MSFAEIAPDIIILILAIAGFAVSYICADTARMKADAMKKLMEKWKA